MASIWRKIYAKMYSFFSSKSYGELKDPETYNKLKNFASKISSLYQSENIDLTKLSSFVKSSIFVLSSVISS